MIDVQAMVSGFKMNLLLVAPFYGDIVSHMEFIEDRNIPTAATDGIRIWINPFFFESMNEGQRNFVLMHEVMHALLMHPMRNMDRDHVIADVAADIIVNNILLTMMRSLNSGPFRMEKPKSGIFQPVGISATFETIYEHIRQKNLKWQAPAGQVYIGGPRSDQKTAVPIPRDLIRVEVAASGSASANEDVNDPENRMRAMITDALRRCGGDAGRSPFGTFPVPQEIYKIGSGTVLNWRSVLKRFLQDKACEESSYTTPERKYIHMDLILPGHGESEESLEEIWAFVDCSGSISKEQTENFLLQLTAILKDFRCTLNVVYWDTAVHEHYKDIRDKKDVLKCIPHHSGGTDINCVYEWIRREKKRIDVMLVLTDGYFGRLSDANASLKLRKRTILVLNSNLNRSPDTDRVGTIARL